MSRTFIGAIKMTYRTIDCGETHCRQRIKKSQACQHHQQLYGNEYNYYLLIIEYPQIQNGDSLFLAEVEDI